MDYETRRVELIAAQNAAANARIQAELALNQADQELKLSKQDLLDHLVAEARRQCQARGTVLRFVEVFHQRDGQPRRTQLWIEVANFDDGRITSSLTLGPKQYLKREVKGLGFAPGTLYVIEGGDQVDTLD